MTHPYIDCMMELRASGVHPEDVASVVCEVGEGTVHRLWEPIQAKRRVPNGYVAKFSSPYCIAVGFLDGAVGFEQFTDERAADRRCRLSPTRSPTSSTRTIRIRASTPGTSG